jgi:hypothetical protein
MEQEHRKLVTICDPNSPYYHMKGYEAGKYVLTNQFTHESRPMSKVIVPSDIKKGIQFNDQKWLGFDQQFII